ncbi:hypothetical protein BPAE_0015g00810 [Botrytis paeoniae]|uniref:Uncharacterized protein n=1 Tax=Botrytis paeoniae TaxID=278948 RepID=A0A4Z1G5U1_9HELO|nr:hypothetical protein BPAE_0015g00810 [Botrytis paeoniae]
MSDDRTRQWRFRVEEARLEGGSQYSGRSGHSGHKLIPPGYVRANPATTPKTPPESEASFASYIAPPPSKLSKVSSRARPPTAPMAPSKAPSTASGVKRPVEEVRGHSVWTGSDEHKGGDDGGPEGQSHRGSEGTIRSSHGSRRHDERTGEQPHRGDEGTVRSSHRSRRHDERTGEQSYRGGSPISSHKSRGDDDRPREQSHRGGSPISSHKSRRDDDRPRNPNHHEKPIKYDESDDGMPQGSRSMRGGDEPRESNPYADSVENDGRSRYDESINDGERSPGSTRTIKNTPGWRRKREPPSESKNSSRSVDGFYTRNKDGSSRPNNDGRDDNRSNIASESGSQRGDGRSRRGGEGSGGKDGKTSSGSVISKKSSKSGKDGGSNKGSSDNDIKTLVSDRHSEKGDGKKVAFSSADKNQAQPLEGIPEDRSDVEGSCYSEENKD